MAFGAKKKPHILHLVSDIIWYLKATKINSCQVIGDKHVYHLKRWLTIRCCILQYPPLPRQQCDEELSFPPSISWLTCATIGWLGRWLTSECRAICLRIDWATGRDWADRLGPGRVSCRYTHSCTFLLSPAASASASHWATSRSLCPLALSVLHSSAVSFPFCSTVLFTPNKRSTSGKLLHLNNRCSINTQAWRLGAFSFRVL